MTQKIAQRLLERQAGKITLKTFDLMAKKRINPALVAKVFIKTNDPRLTSRVKEYLKLRVSQGDKGALNLIARIAEDEKIDLGKRLEALRSLLDLASSPIKLGPLVNKTSLRVFERGISSTNEIVIELSAKGLMRLAERGEREACEGLNTVAKMEYGPTKLIAATGLNVLAVMGEKKSILGLVECLSSKDHLVISTAQKGILSLGKHKYKETTRWINSMVGRTDPKTQKEVISVLYELAKSGDEKAYTGLFSALTVHGHETRWDAINKLAELADETKSKESLNGLEKALKDPTEANRRIAIMTFSRLSKENPKRAFLPLVTAASDSLLVNKNLAKSALRVIAKENPEYARTLKEMKIFL
jgi:HEAT repeat protein